MALELEGKKYVKVKKGGVTYNVIGVNVVKGGVTYNVWGASSAVTYMVDSGVSYNEDVVRGNSVLSPTSFTPSKSGYTFVGWRENNTASNSVLTSKTMGDSPITLYAVFKRDLTLTYYDNSTTSAKKTGTQYYNNGNTSNPSWTMTQADKSGWTKRGWSTATSGNASISYNNGASISISSNTTIYGCYSKTLTLTYYDGSTTAQTKTSTQYYNSAGNTVNPSQTMSQASKSGWTARGWATSNTADASVSYNNGASITFSSNLTIYGCYSQTITLTYYNNSTTAKTSTGTRYYNSGGNTKNPTFTLSQADKSGWTKRGWSTGTGGNASVTYSSISGTTFSANTTVYGLYYQTVTQTFKSYNTSKTVDGTRYYNSAGNTTNASVTAPTGATYSGWTWRGWSAAGTTGASASVSYANGATISGLTGANTYYGLYSQGITCTFYSGLSKAKSATASGTRYYNAYGNTVNASVTAPTGSTVSGWTWRGWSAANTTTANASVSYANGGTISGLSSGQTYYGLYNQTITLSYNGNGNTGGSTSSHTGTRYHNSYGNYSNPSFTLKSNGFSKTGYTFTKWASGSTSGTQYAVGASVTLSASTTFYAVWITTPFYWFNTNSDYSHTYTSGYPTNWTINETCCDDININSTDMHFLDVLCNNHTAFVKATASGATKGCKYATIYVVDINSSNSYIMVNGTKISTSGTHKIDVSNTSTLTLTAYNADKITINYIYFHN